MEPRLPGTTLMEVMVSMTLVSIIFVIGTMIWIQVNDGKSPDRMHRERLIARQILGESRQNHQEMRKVVQIEGRSFVREIRILHERTQLAEVCVSCFMHDGDLILKRCKYIRLHED